jgi:intermediate filament protein if
MEYEYESSQSFSRTVPPHNVVITRTSVTSRRSGDSSTSSRNVRAGQPDVAFNEGDYSLVTSEGVSKVKSTRDHEKKEMQDLNDRFANYLDKVRNLEAQNRKLADELEKLKAKWGKETSQIKAMYQAELDEARRALDDAEREKARLDLKVASLEEQITEVTIKLTMTQQELTMYREKLQQQTQLIADYEDHIQMLRKQMENLEKERDKDQKMKSQLEELLAATREQLDEETLKHIDAENRRQTLEEEIEFRKSVHDQEMKELAALAYRSNSPENRDFWKSQLMMAISEIEEMYEDKMNDTRKDMESSYTLKLQDMRTQAAKQTTEVSKDKEDCKDLRNAVTDLRDRINDLDARNNQLLREIEALRREKEDRERELESENAALRDEQSNIRAELEAVMRELQTLLGSKMSLDLEIAAYRKLLEGEERRTSSTTTRTNISSSGSGALDDLGSSGRGEMSAKTTYSRTAKGAIAVTDCPPDGRCVTIQNTGKKDESVVGYKISRVADGRKQADYVLDDRFKSIPPNAKRTLYAKGYKPATAPSTDIEIDEPIWSIGSTVVTTLVNQEGEDRASLTQKTTYS